MSLRMTAAVLAALAAHSPGSAQAADYQIFDVPTGETVDVFFQVNTEGRVYVRIAAASGEACADFWWIKWPLGTVRQLGRHCGLAAFEIPTGLLSATVAAKLRAGGAKSPLKVGVASNEKVANSILLEF